LRDNPECYRFVRRISTHKTRFSALYFRIDGKPKTERKDYLPRFCQLLPGLVFVGALDFIADLIEKDIVLARLACSAIAIASRVGYEQAARADADFSFTNLTASLLRFTYSFTVPSQLVVDV
jgi:hypothetical protein